MQQTCSHAMRFLCGKAYSQAKLTNAGLRSVVIGSSLGRMGCRPPFLSLYTISKNTKRFMDHELEAVAYPLGCPWCRQQTPRPVSCSQVQCKQWRRRRRPRASTRPCRRLECAPERSKASLKVSDVKLKSVSDFQTFRLVLLVRSDAFEPILAKLDLPPVIDQAIGGTQVAVPTDKRRMQEAETLRNEMYAHKA